MPCKPVSTTPPIRQSGANHRAMDAHLAVLDRHDAQQQQMQSDEVAQVQEAWQARVDRARTLLERINGTRATYGPTVDAISARDWTNVQSTAANLNAIAQIERSCLELASLWESTTQHLSRFITAHEKLSPVTIHSFHAQAQTYADYLRFYADTPSRIDTLWHHLQHLVDVIAARLDVINDADVLTPLPGLTLPAAPTIKVELA
jgi:hypothetical protein